MKKLIISILAVLLIPSIAFSDDTVYGLLILPDAVTISEPVLDENKAILGVSTTIINTAYDEENAKANIDYKITGNYVRLLDYSTALRYIKDKKIYQIYVMPWSRFGKPPISWIKTSDWQGYLNKNGYELVRDGIL